MSFLSSLQNIASTALNPASGLKLGMDLLSSAPKIAGSAAEALGKIPNTLPGSEVMNWIPRPPISGLPGLPALPSLPGLPSLPSLPGLPQLPALPTLPGLPSLPSIPGLPSFPSLPLSPLGGTTAAATAAPAAGPHSATTLAELSNAVYVDKVAEAKLPAGFRNATQADMDKLGLTAADMTTDNGFRARLYVSGTGPNTQYVVAFRGSSVKGDWIANGQQALGLPTAHYSHALEIGRKIALSGATNVTLTGHSLGGGLASAAAVASGRPAQTFNAAGLHDNTINAGNAIRNSVAPGTAAPDVRAYYVRGEILSTLQDGGDHLVGSLLGNALAGPLGGIIGLGADAPEAYGTRIGLDPVAPAGTHWWNPLEVNPINMHKMPWVISSLQGR